MKWKWKHIAAVLCLSFLALVFHVFHWQIVLYLPDNANPSEEGDHTGDHTGDQTKQMTTQVTTQMTTQWSPMGPTPGPFPDYIIRESNKCPEGKPPPFLVLLILTVAGELDARNAIRATWGNESLAPGLGIIRLFLLGVQQESKLGRLQQKTLEAESLRHHDIIQQDFSDTYYNLTLKTLMGMNWVATHCPRASYVMKTDSDMLVNTVYLIHELLRPGRKPKTNYFTGYIMRGGPIRDKSSKWYMPPEEYSNATYPDFCSGTGYVFSGDMATELYRTSLNIPLLRLEDVYVGMCLERLGVKPTPSPDGLFNPWRVPFSRSRYRNIVTSHHIDPSWMLDYWYKMWREIII